ncbi:MAG: hypothetical protein HUJ56_07420 [Erysipelotrichaceae bacterium]|nr:hypothetical protein [Erysipelotrichaceae bacterium]
MEDLPNHYSHTFYKLYVDMLKNEEASRNHAAEEAMEEMTDGMMGG